MNIYEGNNWTIVFVDWCQEFVGDCIISCDKEQLSELTDEDWKELGKLEKELERVCKKLFNATMFNFACLMNNAYRDNEKPHVHFHFIPRYKNELKIFNKISSMLNKLLYYYFYLGFIIISDKFLEISNKISEPFITNKIYL